MTAPVPAAAFAAARAPDAAHVVDGLPTDLDVVAERGPASHNYLRRAWFRAAVATYGGAPRTIVVERGGAPLLALPVVARGPAALGLVEVPGSYWPMRAFPASETDAAPVALAALAGIARALRIGPAPADDLVVASFAAAARDAGWTTLHRVVGERFVLDIAAARRAGPWPRNSTLRKNRFHEKHLAAHGALDWRLLGAEDWPAAFDDLATVEDASWIDAETDGRDAKFTARGHGAFWRAAADDPVLRGMMRGALLAVNGRPSAFSFDLACGPTRYAIANSYVPAYAKHSPGKLLYYRNLVAAADEGTTRVDWGGGDSGYKQTLGAEPAAPLVDRLLVRPGAGGWAMATVLRMLGWRAD